MLRSRRPASTCSHSSRPRGENKASAQFNIPNPAQPRGRSQLLARVDRRPGRCARLVESSQPDQAVREVGICGHDLLGVADLATDGNRGA